MSLRIVWKLRERRKMLEKTIASLRAIRERTGYEGSALSLWEDELAFINSLLGEKS